MGNENLKTFDDHSNAAMTHTSEGIASSDFVMRDLDLNRSQKCSEKVKISGRMHGLN